MCARSWPGPRDVEGKTVPGCKELSPMVDVSAHRVPKDAPTALGTEDKGT